MMAASCLRGYEHLLIRIGLGGVLLFLTGCSQMPTQRMAATQTISPSIPVISTAPIYPETRQETAVMNVVPIPTPFNPGLEKIVTQAINDLADRLATDPEKILLVEVAAITWPDGSLGCPQPGMLYTQVQVDGFRIRFQVGEQIYEYHGGGGRAPFLCQ